MVMQEDLNAHRGDRHWAYLAIPLKDGEPVGGPRLTIRHQAAPDEGSDMVERHPSPVHPLAGGRSIADLLEGHGWRLLTEPHPETPTMSSMLVERLAVRLRIEVDESAPS